MKLKIFNDEWAVGRGCSNITRHTVGGRHYDDGVVATPHGFVDVYAQGDNECYHMTSLRFIHKQMVYSRHIHKRMTRRGMAMVAKRFAKEIAKSK